MFNIPLFKRDFCTVEFHPRFSGNDHCGIMGKLLYFIKYFQTKRDSL